MLKGKRILLGVSGGIAAYKIPILIRLFVKAEAEVKVVATKNALEFISKTTIESLSGNVVYVELFDSSSNISKEHISITDWADIFVVAPATANIIGKFANGIADDALSTTLLAFDKSTFIAPAMNCKMYENFSVQRNIQFLNENGVCFIGPESGNLACGYDGKGRMEEPEIIFREIEASIKKKDSFSGKKVLVSAGPTCETIDAVRFISNHSSGLMGFEIANVFARQGAEVVLVAGPVNPIVLNHRIRRLDVISADEMNEVISREVKNADVIVMTAAVADYKVKRISDRKIKKCNQDISLELEPTKDILAELGRTKRNNQLLIGFALETDDEIENAKKKLHNKNLDVIVLNSLNDDGAGFKVSTNKVSIIERNGAITPYSLKPKHEVAIDIINKIKELV